MVGQLIQTVVERIKTAKKIKEGAHRVDLAS